MGVADIALGKLAKLRFMAFTDPDCTKPAAVFPDFFEVMFNPTTFNEKYTASFVEEKTAGTNANPNKFFRNNPQNLTFEFTLDGTGAINPEDKFIPVSLRIEQLKTVIYTYNGSVHHPNYVAVSYGVFFFKGQCGNLDINYTLFNSVGVPLRAVVTVQFVQTQSVSLSEIIAWKNSPDLTHIRIVKDHDTFTGMCNGIYERNDLFFEAGKSNDLNNFRRVGTGKKLFFPPLSKKT